ncbi:unnamed protein product [Candidula unifasciata]|uniref:AD domain-containing protein n=1 Tax=Candidula unifasciata TaxID=100452 RepID=A0A8S3ZZZ1_9EUPU|nr:unnamed protein product [Candidula unifasciata]
MDPKPQLTMKEVSNSAELHPIFTRDPADWMKWVDHEVQVSTEDGEVHVGHVYTVDPVSESILLITQADANLEASSSVSLKLLIGASVRNVKIISEGTEKVKHKFNHLFRPAENVNLNEEDLIARKLKLKSWLEKHRLPVTLGGISGQYLTVADAITVQPPYTEDSCISTNEIVLSRIQGLIKNMPVDEL